MWIIELVFSDAPERLEARPAHRKRLEQLHGQDVVRMAGPLGDDSGAMIVVDVAELDEVERLIAADPYFSTQGVRVERVREWKPFLT